MTKWIILLSLLSPAAARANTVTPQFTTGSMQSTTTTSQTITEEIVHDVKGAAVKNLHRHKHYSWWNWRHWFRQCYLYANNQRNELGSINNNERSRDNRNNNNRQNNRNRVYYKLLLYLCTISTPVFAEDTNVSNPVAAATGNVTNQAVQFQNNGASSRQIYGPNIQCNGSTMTFSPFYMGNHSKPFDEFMQPSSYTLAENWGFQINFMVPLDKSGYKQCKEMAKRYEEK